MKKPIYDEKEVREICGKFELAHLLRSMSDNIPVKTYETEVGEDYNKRSGRQSRGTFTVPGFVLMNALNRGKPVTLDFSACKNREELFKVMSDGMLWADDYGRNLDALHDVLTGLPHFGERYILIPPEEPGLAEYYEKLKGVFREAGALKE